MRNNVELLLNARVFPDDTQVIQKLLVSVSSA